MSTPPAISTPTSPGPREPETSPKFQLPKGLTSRMIVPEDRERVLEFLRARFFRDEPLNMAVNLLEDENDTCAELEDYCTKSIEEGVSTVVVDKDDKLVAVGLNGLNKREVRIPLI